MWSLVITFGLLGLFQTSAQIIQTGQCNPDINLFPNFNIDNFLGDWYEVSRADNSLQGGDCSRLNFNRIDDVINVRNEAVNRNFYEEITGIVRQEGDTGRLTLDLVGFSEPVDFWVLNTDHNNYAITYKCENIDESQRAVYVWLLGRQQTFTELMQALINTSLNNLLGISTSDLRSTDFSDEACYELPVIDENQPIVLPGQCDSNIEVVQDFDVDAFTGLWHEIASYYSESASGTCARAEYSAEGATVAVLNSHVVDQTLETVSGTAAVIAADGSGKLSVILEVAPGVTTEQELWVLATDYIDYAVLYSCVNQPNDQKRVYSWITSRTRQQNPVAEAAVTRIIDSITDLNAVYYEPMDQSDDGCFYYPEPVEDQPLVFRGQCDMSIPAVADFDAEKYMGLWHEIESYPSVSQTGTCNNARYTLDPSGVVDVFNTQVIDQRLDAISGNATVDEDANGTGKLVVTFPGEIGSSTTNYWILATDYDNYALVYICLNINADERAVWSWKLSRRKELSAAANNAIDAVIDTIPVLDERYYQTRDQTVNGCFYFPEPQSGVPVVFPGQCDNSLPAVADFNLNSFQGVWHEIQTYPTIAQPGQCINHALSAGPGSALNVQSSQIIDQFLSVTTGSVAFASTDGSGRLVITITEGGEVIEIPYWILQTDYVDYALGYSCVNINEDFRGIWSWKLSRSKELSTAANVAIDTAISSIDVLGNAYYEPVDQSDPACFYLPDLEPGEPFVIPGQCQIDIPVVQNFDVERYAGRWHLIETYPSDRQNGTCNDHSTYPQQGSSVVVINNSQVRDERLVYRVASAVPATANNEGKLVVTFPDEEPYDYWILDTDYVSYALVYFCANLDSERRRVWTWKTSRTRNLSETAVERINEVIDSIDVLNNRYYDAIDNSDAGCFYYPDPDGNPVIFRGQCDENISVVADFDVEKYMGIWYNIESYPQEFENGTCSTATYNLTSGGVEVYNTQVIDETLDYIYGRAVLDNDQGLGKLIVTLPVPGTDSTFDSPYWILDTDYDNYALAYACVNLGEDSRKVTSWKLSRQRTLSPASQSAITSTINSVHVLSEEYFGNRDHTDDGCFYYPVPEAGKPVVFPGQCDDSIQAQSDFDLDGFAGLWHEIAAYPGYLQGDQCVNYEFTTATTDSFSLYTTQVIDLSLHEINATVVRTSTDNSARFTITIYDGFEIIEIPYWILQTDYVDYALGYSCVNINEDFRGIWSWKLSRSKELSTAANVAIDTAISSIDVLGNAYYEPVDQSDPACFYLPDLEPGEGFVIPGQCRTDYPVVQNFDLERYAGRWHLIETYPSDFQLGTCNDHSTYPQQGSSMVVVNNTQVRDERLVYSVASAVLATDNNEAKLVVTFPGAEPVDYWILDTDYVSYALVYFCANLDGERRRVWTWKTSRTRDLSETAVERINEVIDSIDVLDNRYYEAIDNSDAGCFYYPDPDGNPVIFRGQCDENISVVADFDVEKYMGIWYNIESYPQEFENGTCSTATYNLTSGGVEVYNTQVIDETLDYIYGRAVLDNDQGLGKLIVTLPVPGTDSTFDSPYWILDTDYDNYALAYACVNLGEDSRKVTSWKLSRQRTLSSDSQSAITSTISSVQVLSEEYFGNRDHTDDGCFYYPVPEAGKPVVFPGQCDDSIQAQSDFDLDGFAGLWHEIAAYPGYLQGDQCVNYEFTTATTDSFSLYTTQVIDLSLHEINATVVRTSTDNSARFTITIYDGFEIIEIPYWILQTDYVDYALGYSCVNINEDFRGIWSWKLSRSKELSTAANVAIDTAISSIDVLGNAYYYPVDQSDPACFYLPDLEPGEGFVIPGQCRTDYPVVQNFDLERYAGRWHLIETYPSDFQLGTCNDHSTYPQQGSSMVVVNNTQVRDERLVYSVASAVLATDNNEAKLVVTFPGAEPVDYWILDTDYVSYALVYFCANLDGERRRVWTWKTSRTRDLSETAVERIDEVIDSIDVLDNRYYEAIDNSDAGCFYYPDPDGNPVIFRGQCDENISVVADFDVKKYMGVWYDIESYPQEFQEGTCATATYSLTDELVVVESTQVVEELLDSINVTAVPAGDADVAKFEVKSPGSEEPVPYWVLATDYDNYAFVYSCSNIDDEYRRVRSWKLSRQQELTAESAASIDAVISNVQVLSSQYYEPRGHSERDCFYYPDNFGGPVVLDGQCQEQSVVDNFNLNQFSGTWHEAARFPSHEQTGECATTVLVINQDSFVLTQTIVYNERLTTVSGPATISGDGRGIITATLQNDDGVSIETTLYVLDTDYTDFALLFSCVNVNEEQKQVYSWKLARTRAGLSESANNRIDEVVSDNVDLHEIYYDYTDQSNDGCFHYPVFEEPPPAIVLPGPCDDRIQAIPNFNLNAYLGRWFEIAKYPQRDQIGECSRAHYSEGQGQSPVDVVNTIVYNQTLETRDGTAVVASTDGSGLLTVTFELDDGVVAVANYYVLATDYTDYALVYSCRDLDSGDSEVYSWKLSRQPTLSNAANNIIDNVISNTRGLLEDYYQPISQSVEDCFYVPEPNPDEAVLFRGECEDLTGMPEFDMSRYVGWWHEIERYPTGEDVGDCISSQYSSSGNSYQVVDTNVFNLTGQVSSGSVVATSNGILIRTMSDGQPQVIFVLATDYETYSLLYSCTPTEDGEYRRVWSAKHSKARALSEAAQAAMEPVIAANEVLHDQLYVPVDQRDAACFHYPPAGERVVLPGQCDESIPDVANFDPVQYTGTWYQLERYPHGAAGTCAGARYAYDADTSVVSVLNWHVADGILHTVEGTATVDGAKLLVTLPVEGTNDTATTELRILHSDYVTYSVAYSCTNVNQFQRAVEAFKFSRTRDLPDSAVTSINNYMASREELHQGYFEIVEHDDCLEPSSALIVRGGSMIIVICAVLQLCYSLSYL